MRDEERARRRSCPFFVGHSGDEVGSTGERACFTWRRLRCWGRACFARIDPFLTMTRERFPEALREAMLTLPQDCKAMLRLADDPDLDDDSRVLACGALLHLLSGTNAIPGVKGTLAFADDVIVLRLTVAKIATVSPDIVQAHREDDPEVFEAMESQLESVREALGDLMSVLDRAVEGLPKLQYEGHSAAECARDEEGTTWLYDSVHEAIVERLELKPDDVARAVKSANDLKTFLRQRM